MGGAVVHVPPLDEPVQRQCEVPRLEARFDPEVQRLLDLDDVLGVAEGDAARFRTGPEEVPHAILIRAIYPQLGLETMQQRRKNKPLQLLANGPAKLCQAMGIDLQQNGVEIGGSTIWLGEKHAVEPDQIAVGPRIGVDYAGEDALLPYRFVWVNPSL